MFSADDKCEFTSPATSGQAGHVAASWGPLLMSATLSFVIVIAIMIAATAVSMGFARAQTLNAIAEPDTGLVLAMLAAAIGVMGGLSAVAVRLAGRSRPR